jgi:FkbM family methyltransferase
LLEWLVVGLFVLAMFQARANQRIPKPEDLNSAIKPFADRYGSNNSEHGEEWLIRDFYHDRRGGVFVDVGANHYRRFNNTYYLDVELGWTGIAVEPQTRFSADYATFRPNTRFRSWFVSDQSDEQAKIYTLRNNSLVTSATKTFTERFGSDVREDTVATITLNDLLTAEGIQQFDFLNMDIELWEPKALAGFDIKRFRPSLVCIESHQEVMQQILDYFAVNGYVVVAKYLRLDVYNLYFTPIKE